MKRRTTKLLFKLIYRSVVVQEMRKRIRDTPLVFMSGWKVVFLLNSTAVRKKKKKKSPPPVDTLPSPLKHPKPFHPRSRAATASAPRSPHKDPSVPPYAPPPPWHTRPFQWEMSVWAVCASPPDSEPCINSWEDASGRGHRLLFAFFLFPFCLCPEQGDRLAIHVPCLSLPCSSVSLCVCVPPHTHPDLCTCLVDLLNCPLKKKNPIPCHLPPPPPTHVHIYCTSDEPSPGDYPYLITLYKQSHSGNGLVEAKGARRGSKAAAGGGGLSQGVNLQSPEWAGVVIQ